MRSNSVVNPVKSMVAARGVTTLFAKPTLPCLPGASCSLSGSKVLPSTTVFKRSEGKRSSMRLLASGPISGAFTNAERF